MARLGGHAGCRALTPLSHGSRHMPALTSFGLLADNFRITARALLAQMASRAASWFPAVVWTRAHRASRGPTRTRAIQEKPTKGDKHHQARDQGSCGAR